MSSLPLNQLNQVDEEPSEPSNVTPNPEPTSWHPKVTLYRLVVVGLTLGIGTAKAVANSRGESIVSTTLEWIFGVAISLVLFFLSDYESDSEEAGSTAKLWIFHVDYANILWVLLRRMSIPVPSYQTREISRTSGKSRHPSLTGYRFLVSFLTASFGISKALLSYLGYSYGANTVDWVFGMVITTSLYWLGLYENSTTRVLPEIFEEDYSFIVKGTPYVILQITLLVLCPVLLVLIGFTWTDLRAFRPGSDEVGPTFMDIPYGIAQSILSTAILLWLIDITISFLSSRFKRRVRSLARLASRPIISAAFKLSDRFPWLRTTFAPKISALPNLVMTWMENNYPYVIAGYFTIFFLDLAMQIKQKNAGYVNWLATMLNSAN